MNKMMELDKSPDALKTIGEVADEIGVATHVLRFWEGKFRKQIKPQKRRGRRYYRPDDIIAIRTIKELLYTEGYTIKGVQNYFKSHSKISNDNISSNSQQNIFANENQPVSGSSDKGNNTDLFGNAIDDNSKGNISSKKDLTSTDIEKLKKVYNGLCKIREILQKAA